MPSKWPGSLVGFSRRSRLCADLTIEGMPRRAIDVAAKVLAQKGGVPVT